MPAKPSDTELILLRQLWHHKRLSARELHNASVDQTGWAYSTTRKTLDRMVEKEILQVELVHGIKTFIPTQSKMHTVAQLIQHFTTTILDSETPLPAATFISSTMVDESELDELQLLLDNFGQENTKKGKK